MGHPEAQNVDWLLGFPRSHKTWVAHSGTCITDTSFTGSLFFFPSLFHLLTLQLVSPGITSQTYICARMHAQSCPTLCDPVDCCLPVPSILGILWARIQEWVAIPSSRGSSQPRYQTHVSCISCIAGEFFTAGPLGNIGLAFKPLSKGQLPE